jgi:hypothetical protein
MVICVVVHKTTPKTSNSTFYETPPKFLWRWTTSIRTKWDLVTRLQLRSTNTKLNRVDFFPDIVLVITLKIHFLCFITTMAKWDKVDHNDMMEIVGNKGNLYPSEFCSTLGQLQPSSWNTLYSLVLQRCTKDHKQPNGQPLAVLLSHNKNDKYNSNSPSLIRRKLWRGIAILMKRSTEESSILHDHRYWPNDRIGHRQKRLNNIPHP